MTFIFTPYALFSALTAVISALVALLALQRRTLPGGKSLTGLLLSVFVWSTGSALEYATVGYEMKMVWFQFEYFGVLSCPVFFLLFALEYCRFTHFLTRRAVLLLSLLPIATIIVAVIPPLQHLIWVGCVEYETATNLVVVAHGPVFWITVVGYSYLLIVAGTVLLLRAAFQLAHHHRRQIWTIVAGALAPWFANILYVTGTTPVPGLEMTPIVMTLSGIGFALNIFQFRLLDIVPMARNALIESMSDGMVVFDHRDRLLDINPSARGYLPGGDGVDFGMAASDVFADIPPLVRHLGTRLETRIEIEWTDPRDRALEFSVSPIRDRRERLIGRLVVIRDITKRKTVEEGLLRSEAQYRLLAENMADVIWTLSPDGRFTYVSPSVVSLRGYTPQEVLQQSAVESLTPRSAAIMQAALAEFMERLRRQETIEPTDSMSFELEQPCKDGSTVWTEAVVRALFDAHGAFAGMLGVSRDITDRLRAQQAVAEARDAAEESNRLKSEFLANMSHEIRTPLNAVIGFSELLKNVIHDDKHKQYIDTISVSGNNLLTLINDILDLSKIEAGKIEFHPQPVNVHALVEEIGLIFRQKIDSKQLGLLVEVGKDFPEFLLIDEARTRQILLNVVGNAVKFTQRGHVRVVLQQERAADVPGALTVRLVVEDTGIGIPANEQENIFESFRQKSGQSTREYGGTGLGLTITKKLVEMMNGRISLTSEPGKGSTFTIEFFNVHPTVADTATREIALSDMGRYQFSDELVLVVDDVQSNRELIQEMLTKVCLRVVTAENGHEAITRSRDLRPALVIMDIMMPVMGGDEAARRIREAPETRDIPIVALTAAVAHGDAHDAPFDGTLMKPVRYGTLLREIARFLPNQLSTGDDAAPRFSDSDLSALELPPELVLHLRARIRPMLEKTTRAMTMDAVHAVADVLVTAGTEFGAPGVRALGDELSKSALRYDIVHIKSCLAILSAHISEDNENE